MEENFKLKAGVNEIKYLGENGEVVVGEVWGMFNKASFLQCNGFDEKISPKAAPALVEIGLCVQKNEGRDLTVSDFEPLVLETCRLNFETQKDTLENWIRKDLDNSDKGKRFEACCQYFKPFRGEKSLLEAEYFPKLSKAQASKLEEARSNELYNSVWKAFPPKFGKMAIGFQKSGKSFYQWFEECSKEIHLEASLLNFAYYPDNFAGPDFAAFVKNAQGNVALALFQCKFGENPDWKESRLTVDPALLYHNNRGDKSQSLPETYKTDHEEFLKVLRDFPVIRVVIAAKHEFRAVVELVEHHRVGSKYPVDLQIAVSGNNLMAVFEDGLGKFFQEA